MKNLRLPSRLLMLTGALAVATAGTSETALAQTMARRTTATPSVAAPLALNRVLVFSKTKGFRHSSIPAGKMAIMKLGKENGFAVDTTEDAGKFTEANLKQYGAVIWLSTTGNVLDDAQQAAFERYIQAGGGYVGIHAAADTEYDWPWYNKLVGAYFLHHPKQQNAEIEIVDKSHPSTKMLPDRWKRWDEWYSYKSIQTDLKVLGKLDEKTYEGGKNGDNHPFIWHHEVDGGKAFYTGGGHTDESYTDAMFLQHILGGIKSVMATSLKFGQAKTKPYPEENRFEQQVLIAGMDEPTELAVLDNGKVLYTQRKGELRVYDPKKKTVKTVANFPVFTKFEYGLMGLNIDPNFKQNKWIYVFYSPVTGKTVADTAQHLSRFVYDDVKDTVLLNTEKVLLTIPVKRDGCCHTGGSIAWDKKGNLYLSTGDDTNPFNSNGYAPIDERPGRSGWDARLTSSNTNDLRGKIIRIHPEADGTYTIPEGNLFPKGNPKARPEIYVMGNRNPYRISVDQRTGFLYWGEVGPDAGENSDKYGPRGHDEINQARQAGYYGWPLFVADNRPYHTRTFADSTTGALFDPMKPINDSPNNTGLRELPPAQKAFIYYPYADSPEFGEIVGKGGRNGMGGPVYYYDDYPETPVKFPRHYDGKFFAYDWIRDWIHPVTMKENGDFVKMETFMPNTKFSHVIDMQFANDGSLYTIEYGQKWFGANTDARLSHITYNAGNRKPVAVASANKMVGAAPLTVKFDGKESVDYDGDVLKYEWSFGKAMPKQTSASPTVTFSKPGVYPATLKVTDAAGNVATKTMDIKVGNDEPKVEVTVAGNKTFYFPNKPVKYSVKVMDKEDGTLQKGISPDDVTMTIDYLEGFDKTMLAQGHQANTGFSTGKRLIDLSDCKACHTVDQKSIGPAYMDVAKKYKGTGSESKLIRKIITGGGGVWGEQAMSAHPQLKESEVADMVSYILSLADSKAANRKPIAGDYVPAEQKKDGSYILTATYTDKGNGVIGPLTGSTSLALRSPSVKAISADMKQDIFQYDIPKMGPAAVGIKSGSYIAFKDIDMTGIEQISPTVFASTSQTAGGKLEARINSPTGPLIGEAEVKQGTMGPVNIPIRQPVQGMQKLYLVFVNPNAGQNALFAVDKIQFTNQGM
ncbi:ThuA domain-containing protein [Spirosoma sp. BT702]|uniref:ThuA domain-containing protein n=1 Tax=Spirosoma profusum TaxID=2771354 RepID=A0A926XSP3_9BACT|nr:ThuA domain-containing protein [Spirosoma profusum]MBD2699274.1 ThuA domain-containing protein [Spirosoma profusum]